MLAISTFLLAILGMSVAQVSPEGQPPPMAPGTQPPLESGACLDSPHVVPKALMKPVSRAMQIVRIDEIVSTATMTPGEVVGFLYTTQDGGTWLGERTPNYMSPANATEINTVLAATHVTGVANNTFPPESRYGVPTKYPQIFRVHVPPDALTALRIQIVPCVVWPSMRPLPDPAL